MARLVGINHVALEVGDVDAALELYGRLFDFELRGRAGRMAFPDVRAFTSARRWEEGGVMATTARNLGLQALYALGFPPERLARLYGYHA